jgi:signal peptidase II
MDMLKRAALILIVLITSVGCDQVTKEIARTRLPELRVYSFLGDLFRLQLTENHGAFLSLGAALSESNRFLIFTAMVGFALLGVLVYMLRKPNIGAFNIVSISLILGGGIGNLIDRILFNGGVTDFLNVGIGQLRTGIFNVADVAIMAGVGMLLYWSLRHQKRA